MWTVALPVLMALPFHGPGNGTLTEKDWPGWRGPSYDGSSVGEGLPTEFSLTESVIWSAKLPGTSAATPVIGAGRVFVTAAVEDTQELWAFCFDQADGRKLWGHAVGSGYVPEGADEASKIQLHGRSNYASPSPVTDGERVIFFFGNGDLISFDLDGNEQWRRNLQVDRGDFNFQWTFSASPTLWDDQLFLPILQRNAKVNGRGEDNAPSYLLCMDPATGETIYEHERPSSARKESLESYATAIPYVGDDGRKELLVVGGDVITGHDPESGEELWRWGTWNEGHRQEWWRVVPSAVVGQGMALVCAPKRAPVYAVKLGGSGDLGDAGLAWQSEGRPNPVSSDVPTPLYYDGSFYVLSDVRASLSRVNAADGEVKWTVAMPGKSLWRASPTGADGKIWCMNHAGTVAIIDAASGEFVNQIEMGTEDDDLTRSSIAVAGNRLFIRVNSGLYCIGK